MTDLVDVDQLRAEVQEHYAEVAHDPHGEFHFHTGRTATTRLGYDDAVLERFPDACIEAFAGVANPFAWGFRTPGNGSSTSDPAAGWMQWSPHERSATRAGSWAWT